MKIKLNVDNNTITTNKGKVHVKLAPIEKYPNQGLSINENGELIATRGTTGEDGVTGMSNNPGNSIGVEEADEPMAVLGCNSTVSRYKPAEESSGRFCKTNDGVVVCKLNIDGNIIGGLAYYLLLGE